MKKILIASVAVLVLASFSSFLPSRSDFGIYDNVIRFHVIANSDSDEDQAQKLRVRDRILTLVGEKLEGAETKDEAEAKMAEVLPEIEASAAAMLDEENSDYTVAATLTEEKYPRKSYGTVTLPSGTYTSLRVIIGEGEGHNWWCVLFPRMCTKPALSESEQKEDFADAGFTPSQYRIITDSDNTRYVIKFRIIEFFKGLFD